MRFLSLFLCAALVFGAWASTAEANSLGRGYLKNDPRLMAQLYFAFFLKDRPTPGMIDQYAHMTHCKLFEEYYHNDFEWIKIRKAIERDIRAKSTNKPSGYELGGEISIGRYDFEKGGFPLEKPFESVAFLDMSFSDNVFSFCDVDGPKEKSLPSQYRVRVSFPFTLKTIEISEAAAKNAIPHMYRDLQQRDSRKAYIRFRVTVTGMTSVLGEYDVDDAFIMNGRIDAVDIFIDQEMTKKLTSIDIDQLE